MNKNFDWTKFWQKHPPIWIKISSWFAAKFYIRLFEELDVKTFLELGGGPGYLAKLIAQKLGYRVTLVDNNPTAYQLFKQLSNFGDYIREDFFEYKPKEKFDLVCSFGVVEHYPKKEKRIKVIKIHKNLSKKYVAIFVPKDSFFVKLFFHSHHGFEKLYAKAELENELKAAGLKPSKFAKNLLGIGFLCDIR